MNKFIIHLTDVFTHMFTVQFTNDTYKYTLVVRTIYLELDKYNFLYSQSVLFKKLSILRVRVSDWIGL